MKIGVIGTGFVGTAFISHMSKNHHIVSYDRQYGLREFTSCSESSLRFSSEDDVYSYMDGSHPANPVFISVPTPMNTDGSCNTSIVEQVVASINNSSKSVRDVVIRSTVPPGTTAKLSEKYKKTNCFFNPEFLTEMNAVQDFVNQDRIIIGGTNSGNVKKVYTESFPHVPIFETDSTTAEMVKYLTNCFLATKVSFANEIFQICESLNIDYNKLIEYATKDKRLGTSHWKVPGPMPSSDGSGKLLKGFSGSCFIKDLNAIIVVAKSLGIDPKIMSAAWDKNLEVRPEKDWEQLKGRAVT